MNEILRNLTATCVSYDTAVALKKLGYREPCRGYYHYGKLETHEGTLASRGFCYNDGISVLSDVRTDAPFIEDAVQWMERMYKIHIEESVYEQKDGRFTVIHEAYNINRQVVARGSRLNSNFAGSLDECLLNSCHYMMETFEKESKFEAKKLTYAYGCLANTLNVDDIEEADMTNTMRVKVLLKLKEKLDITYLNEFMQFMAERYGDMEYDDEPCECCGDTVTTYTLEL